MGSVNKVILLGHLGADPELKSFPSGDSVVNLNMATSETYKDKSGQKQERTEWHRVEFQGRSAEVIHEYCRKGSQLFVEGSLRTDKWQDKEGNDRWTTKVRGFRFTFVGPRDRSGGGESGGDESRGGGRAGGDSFGDMDDVPF